MNFGGDWKMRKSLCGLGQLLDRLDLQEEVNQFYPLRAPLCFLEKAREYSSIKYRNLFIALKLFD